VLLDVLEAKMNEWPELRGELNKLLEAEMVNYF